MKSEFAILASTCLATAANTTVQGFDISHYQTNVDFVGAYEAGARFVIIKVPIHPSQP